MGTDRGTPVSDRVAHRAIAIRDEAKLTRSAVADAMRTAGVDMTVASLRNFEDRRRRDLTLDAFVALAAALGVSPAELLDEDDAITFGLTRPAEHVCPIVIVAPPGAVGTAVHDDIEMLGDLIGTEPSLAEAAYVLAAAIDAPGADPKLLAGLVKELRAVLADISPGRVDTGGDDDLADMDDPV